MGTHKFQETHQSEYFEEVQVGVNDVLDALQPLLAQGTHGVADAVQPHSPTGEYDEALQQGLAAGDIFELQVWDAEGKLRWVVGEREKKVNALVCDIFFI